MAAIELLCIRIGTFIATTAGKLLLGGHRSKAEREFSLLQLAGARNVPIFSQRRLDRQFQELADVVSERLLPLVQNELPRLPDNERNAAILVVLKVLEGADFSDEFFLSADLNESKIYAALTSASLAEVRRALLSADAAAYVDLILRESIAYLVEVIVTLPSFQGRSLKELLSRDSEIIELLREVLRRMPPRTMSGVLDEEAQFHLDYSREMARKYDQIEIFGLTNTGPSRKYSLSVAYIGLDTGMGRRSASARHRSELSAEELVSRSERVFIRGEAGSGKTTLLQWLAIGCAQQKHEGFLRSWNGLTPFVIQLRRFAKRDLPAPADFLTGVAPNLVERMPTRWVDSTLRSGKAVLLIDGIDEFPDERRRGLHDWISGLVSDYPDMRFVVTSRPSAVARSWLADMSFEAAELRPMNRVQVASFVRHWHDAVSHEVSIKDGLHDVSSYRTALEASLDRSTPLRSLASNPLLCALLCALNWNRKTRLPKGRLEIYKTALDMLLGRRDYERQIPAELDLEISNPDKIAILAGLAYWFTTNEFADAEYSRAEDKVRSLLQSMPHLNYKPGVVLRSLLLRSGLLREPSLGRVDFIHKTFQEYLAASRIVEEDLVESLLTHAKKPSYHEVIVMAAGIARKRESEDLVTALLDEADGPEVMREGDRARLRLLVVNCVEVMTRISPALYERVLNQLRMLAPPKTLGQASILGSLGEGAVDILPDEFESLTRFEAVATVRTAAIAGGPRALSLIKNAAGDERTEVVEQVLQSWGSFNSKEFAEVVLNSQKCSWDLQITDPYLLEGATVVERVRRLTCHISDSVEPRLFNSLRFVKALAELSIANNLLITTLPMSEDAVSMRSLEIRRCPNLKEIENLEKLSNLHNLIIEDCNPWLSDSLESLRELRVLELHTSSRQDLEGIFTSLKHITRLSLVGDPGVRGLGELGPSDSLEYLAISSSEQLAQLTGLERFPRLSELVLDNCENLESFLGIEGASQSLKSLALANIDHISDVAFLSRMRYLERLSIGLYEVDDPEVLLDLPRLRLLSLSKSVLEGSHVLEELRRKGVDVEYDYEDYSVEEDTYSPGDPYDEASDLIEEYDAASFAILDSRPADSDDVARTLRELSERVSEEDADW